MAYETIGNNNGGVGVDYGTLDLFKIKMMTDVLRYFQDTNIGKELITVKTIENGKSASFPIIGNNTAELKTNNADELVPKSTIHTDRIINIAGLLVSYDYITDLDDAMVHYDAKAGHTESIGRALAKKFDLDLFTMVKTAGGIVDAAAATTAGLKDFSDDIFTQPVEIAIADLTNGAKVYAACVAAVVEYEDKDVVGKPNLVLAPKQYYAMLNNPANTGLTWVNDEYAQSGKVPLVLGARVFSSPHLVKVDGVTVGDMVGHLFAKEAVGCIELMSTQVAADYVPTRLSWLIVGKMAVGFGILNHTCAINIQVKA